MAKHRTTTRSVRAIAALAMIFAVAGCSGTAANGWQSDEATEVSVSPATGPTISGTGYSFAAPEGWSVPPETSFPNVDKLAANMTDADGFTDNVNVILSSSGLVSADEIETAGVDELEAAGADNVTVRNQVLVGGAEWAHLAASFGSEYSIEQYYVSNDAQTFVVTFSFSQTVSEPDRDALAHSVLASWSWA